MKKTWCGEKNTTLIDDAPHKFSTLQCHVGVKTRVTALLECSCVAPHTSWHPSCQRQRGCSSTLYPRFATRHIDRDARQVCKKVGRVSASVDPKRHNDFVAPDQRTAGAVGCQERNHVGHLRRVRLPPDGNLEKTSVRQCVNFMCTRRAGERRSERAFKNDGEFSIPVRGWRTPFWYVARSASTSSCRVYASASSYSWERSPVGSSTPEDRQSNMIQRRWREIRRGENQRQSMAHRGRRQQSGSPLPAPSPKIEPSSTLRLSTRRTRPGRWSQRVRSRTSCRLRKTRESAQCVRGFCNRRDARCRYKVQQHALMTGVAPPSLRLSMARAAACAVHRTPFTLTAWILSQLAVSNEGCVRGTRIGYRCRGKTKREDGRLQLARRSLKPRAFVNLVLALRIHEQTRQVDASVRDANVQRPELLLCARDARRH